MDSPHQHIIVTDFSPDREKMITRYIMNHPGCSRNKVIEYCARTNGGPVKKTVEGILQKLEDDGIVTEKPNPNDKRAFCYTVESENLLEILPKDLENIFSELFAFTKLIKQMIENGNPVGEKPLPNHISEIVTYEAKSSLPFLPYYITEIITSFYMFYFSFVVPQKIENQKLINKLYSWYFENLSKVYSFLLTELSNTLSSSGNIAMFVKSQMNVGNFENERPGLYPVYRTVRICRIIGIEEQLFNVLHELWIRNEKSASLLYALNDNGDALSKKDSISKVCDASIFESKYKDLVKNNKTLRKIHHLVDCYIYQQEKGEEEAERNQFEAENTYNPYD